MGQTIDQAFTGDPLLGTEAESSDDVHWWQRTLPSILALTIVLFLLAQLTDPAGYLSTDVGGKTATIEVIIEDGPRAPDLGYWAEEFDEDGSLYPMWSTGKVGDSWVNVTTLPMLYVAVPLWKLGGPRLAVLIPVLGTVLAAAGAAALAARIGGDRRQRSMAFWLVGLASPATIYALDFWEHSLGLALITWGMVLALDAGSDQRIRWWVPLAAGLAFSGAASMRQEALIYGVVAGVVLVGRLTVGAKPLTAVLRGGAMIIGTGLGLAANAAFEWWVFDTTLRAGRGGSTAAAAGTDLMVRLEEAVVTGVAPMAGTNGSALLVAGLLFALLVALGVKADAPATEQRMIWAGLAAVAALTVLDLLIDGLRFVPGMAATTPLAVFGLARGLRRGPARAVTAMALAALPVVWMTQFAGGASAQWGGRYILPSGLLLLVVAVVTYDTGRAHETMRKVAVAGLAITIVGLAWAIVRTHGVADAGRVLADRPEDALLFHDPFLAREPGPLGLDERWLAAPTAALVAEAGEVLAAAGVERVGYVDYDIGREVPDIPGYVPVGESTIGLVNDLRLRIVTFERTS
ncbi:MAG: hypothetical protein R2707_03235 [Acidimicrobiales bacterium]